MVGAAIAVLAEGAPEFADDHHHRVLPCRTLLVGEGGEPAPELLEPGGEEAARSALADVRVPAADVDEADVELLLHELRHAACLGLEAARSRRPGRARWRPASRNGSGSGPRCPRTV